MFLLQHYHPIRHIHCQTAASEFLTDFDSWDMLTIIGSRSPGLSFSDKIKFIQQFKHVLLMNFKNLEKCDILKNA